MISARADGALRIAVTCAGIGWAEKTAGKRGPHSVEPFHKVVEVNLLGSFHLLRAAGAAMLGNEPDDGGEAGVIVLTASIAAYDGQIGQLAYAASKGGVVGMTLPAARDLASAPHPRLHDRAGPVRHAAARRACPRRRAPRSAPRCRTPRGSGAPTSTPRSPRTSSRTRCSTARSSASTARCACRRAERPSSSRSQSHQLRCRLRQGCGSGAALLRLTNDS